MPLEMESVSFFDAAHCTKTIYAFILLIRSVSVIMLFLMNHLFLLSLESNFLHPQVLAHLSLLIIQSVLLFIFLFNRLEHNLIYLPFHPLLEQRIQPLIQLYLPHFHQKDNPHNLNTYHWTSNPTN